MKLYLLLKNVNELLENEAGKTDGDSDIHFVYKRIKRAKLLSDKITGLLESPFLKINL